MTNFSRRNFLQIAAAATLAAAASRTLAATSLSGRKRVFIGANTPEGILAYDWNPATGELTPAGVAARIANVDWIAFSPGHEFLYAASEVDSFNGKPTGAVASFRVANGELHPLSTQNSASMGTCHVALDRSGRVLLAADYGGGSAASFLVTDGRLSSAVWSDHYTAHGPNPARQQSAHAHFASFSPDNRFAYINDLGGDCIHIYSLNYRHMGQLPCRAVLEQARDQRGVHGVAGALGHHVALDAPSGQSQVADQVQHLVAHILVGKAQRAVLRALRLPE
jgi:6-phosphogluconolactonase